ncbi:hypothetical protein SZ64_04985 [Erythrobacter sp. SG61-1L]|uniref:hypothetical protein n=1 Tax=Erythrobacter sp. SG61-1L TaxID=1603897 RepID=UPI0006C921B9|nr:hypothetical protein [Erythrobacter sp. SG61-1L]KPL67517.1 hypothetical protein SZ64_04985 [Erythrobacter sp. SG61-1L]
MTLSVLLRSSMPLAFITLGLTGCNLVKSQQEEPEAAPIELSVPTASPGAGSVPSAQAGTPARPGQVYAPPAPATIPAGTDVTKLESLSDVAKVNLGLREGDCSFVADGKMLIKSAAMRDPATRGRAFVLLGKTVITLNGAPGGFEAIRAGTTFSGQGVTVSVKPAAGTAQSRPANVTVGSADGKVQSYSGEWVCS